MGIFSEISWFHFSDDIGLMTFLLLSWFHSCDDIHTRIFFFHFIPKELCFTPLIIITSYLYLQQGFSFIAISSFKELLAKIWFNW